jgi:HAAS
MASAGDPGRKMDAFLREVKVGLRGMPEREASDILAELRSHILERAEAGSALAESGVDAALESLGSPAELASLYLTENLMARAENSRSPWLILRSTFRWAALSFVGFFVCLGSLLGYLLGGIFLFSAVAKLFSPSRYGVWISTTGPWSLSIGPAANPGAKELLGWWLVPLGLVCGVGLLLLTTRFGLWSIRMFRRSHAVGMH